jgi:hypothetical protein
MQLRHQTSNASGWPLIAKYRSLTRIRQFDHFCFTRAIKIPPLADFFYGPETALAKPVTIINTAYPHTWGWNFLV